jgi:hypothetical protein
MLDTQERIQTVPKDRALLAAADLLQSMDVLDEVRSRFGAQEPW